MKEVTNYKDEITDELIARYLEDAGDLSEYEKTIAEKWARDNPYYYDFLRDDAPFQQNNNELDLSKSLGKSQKIIPFNSVRRIHHYRVAASIAVIAAIGLVLSWLLLPSRDSGTMQAGMGPTNQTYWHNTEMIPKEWDLNNGSLMLDLEWESNASHSRMEISFDGDSWCTIAEDKNSCEIQYDSSICMDTLYWYLTFIYDNQQESNASGQIKIIKP